jgi:hypothetical protein
MPLSPKVPPRFVPTLTEVVQGLDMAPFSVPLPQPVQPPVVAAPALAQAAPSFEARAAVADVPMRSIDKDAADISAPKPGQTSSGTQPPVPQGMEEYMVHRVMQRVDVVLDHRLREAIALVVQEQTRSVLPRLREEIESVVRHAVYEAVADELAGGNPLQSGR